MLMGLAVPDPDVWRSRTLNAAPSLVRLLTEGESRACACAGST